MYTKNGLLIIVDRAFDFGYLSFFNKLYNAKKDIQFKLFSSATNSEKTNADIYVHTGGADVNPKLYNEEMGNFTSINRDRDEENMSMFNIAQKYNILQVGICRGAQFLTVANGGKLIQHVENHNQDHNIELNIKEINSCLNNNYYLVDEPGDESMVLKMTSTHHQMMFPFNLDKNYYKILAHSEYNRSNIYLNGKNENINLPSNFVEPEIVWYPNSKSLAIQGHPEYGSCPYFTTVECLKLINKFYENK